MEFECKFFICELNIIRDLKLLKTFCVFSKNFNYTPITYLFFIAKFRTTLKFDKGLACWACCHCLSKKKDLLQRKSCKLNFEMKNKNKCVPSHRPNNIRIQPTEYSGYYIEPQIICIWTSLTLENFHAQTNRHLNEIHGVKSLANSKMSINFSIV